MTALPPPTGLPVSDAVAVEEPRAVVRRAEGVLSEIGELLARLRAAEDLAGGFTRSNSVSTSAEVRRLARAWASIVREALDRFMLEGDAAGD